MPEITEILSKKRRLIAQAAFFTGGFFSVSVLP